MKEFEDTLKQIDEALADDYMPPAESSEMMEVFQSIAKKYLDIPTLRPRNMDDLDFHEVSVWEVVRALDAAYREGLDRGFGQK
jgi:hypothetical protein